MRLHLSYNIAARAAGTGDESPAIIGPTALICAEGFPQSRRGKHISFRRDIYDIIHFATAFFL